MSSIDDINQLQPSTSSSFQARDIPDQIQRTVRQRCGFGCVICGLPLYEYEHLEGWAKVHRHAAEEITLLCDQHHREKESGLMPLAAVIEANKNPRNKRIGISTPYNLHFKGSEYIVELGSNIFSSSTLNHMTAISVDNTSLISFSLIDDHLLLNVSAFDEDNNLILTISNNRLSYSISPWDITFIGTRLIVRDGSGKFFIDITFLPQNKIKFNRGRILYNKVDIRINSQYIALANDGRILSKCLAKDCQIALAVGISSEYTGAGFLWNNVPRHNTDRSASLKEAKRNFKKIQNI